MRGQVRRRPAAALPTVLTATTLTAAALTLATLLPSTPVTPGAGPAAAATRAFEPVAGCRALSSDAVHRRTLTELDAWVAWLRRGRAQGFVGELGWPDGGATADGGRWDCLADAWYDRADAAGLHAAAWLASEHRGSTHELSVYENDAPGRPLSSRSRQAAVLERHRGSRSVLRGVNVSGAENGLGSTQVSLLSRDRPGTYGVTHAYPSAAGLRFLASRGVRLVRLPVRWERLQPRLRHPLAAAELSRLLATVDAGRRAGMTVVVDLHNYGGYWVDGSDGEARRLRLGSPALTTTHLVDVWTRLSAALGRRDRVVLGLMNEPAELGAPGRDGRVVWESASRAVVRALRARGERRVVAVAGYAFSSLARWPELHPDGPWVDDPLDRMWYEAHHYWDFDHSSTYDEGYAEQVRRQRQR